MSEPDAFVRICPSRNVLARIGDKWSSLIIAALSDAPLRFGELKRRLDGISQKMLSQTLQNLERDGLVRREVFDQRPLRVEYSLTHLGESLSPLLLRLKVWSEENLHIIERARERYDDKA